MVLFGIWEVYQHHRSISNIPIRIHINGARGKSSVTRLISAGLRAGGFRTIGKTTGSAPRVIDIDGKDRIIHRLRSASIGEQIKSIRSFSKKKIDALVIECMAVLPQYQWIAEHKMVKSTISVITNVRPDHIDEMGPTMEDIANSLGNTIPFNGTLITAERDMLHTLSKVAESRDTDVQIASPEIVTEEFMYKFPYVEHRENVALALKVCRLLKIDDKTALKGMLNAQPDPGALFIQELKFTGSENYFVNAFAANDPQSTHTIWESVSKRLPNYPACVFLNTRDDRRSRTEQLLEMTFQKIKPSKIIIRGDNIPDINNYKNGFDFDLSIFPNSADTEQIISDFESMNNHIIFGIGNMVGWGEQLVKELREYKNNG